MATSQNRMLLFLLILLLFVCPSFPCYASGTACPLLETPMVAGRSGENEHDCSCYCQDIFFHIPVEASVEAGVFIPAAVYDISAAYCPPTKYVDGRSDTTVQLLLHGAIDNKYYWSALGPVGSSLAFEPSNYSWVDYAREEGYHTVAIDRLGAGNSSHPDPDYVRLLVQVEIIKEITTILRRGGHFNSVSKSREIISSPVDDRAVLPTFEKVLGVGQSFGSVLLGLTLPLHPHAFDAAIMCGFILSFELMAPDQSAIIDLIYLPAREVFPTRFGDLDPGYKTVESEEYYRQQFFSLDSEFDPSVIAAIYEHVDVQASGEVSSIYAMLADPKSFLKLYNVTGTGFEGDVAFFVGEEDGPFCNGDCHSGPENFVASSLAYYSSSARNYAAFEVPNTGHMLNFHYSAHNTVAKAHDWLAECGY